MSILDKQTNTLLGLYLYFAKTASPATTTLSAAVAAGASSIPLTAASTFANGMDVFLGTGETLERFRVSSGGSTATLVPVKPLKFDHAASEPLVEANAVNLGVPEADGFKLAWNGDSTDIFTAISRLAYTVLPGFQDITASFRFPTVTVDGIALALGIARSNLIGDGTNAAAASTTGPRQFCTDGTLFNTQTQVCLTAAVQLFDGSYVAVDLYNLTFDPTQFSVTFARGQLSTVPVKCMASSGAIDFTNSLFTPAATIATYAASNGDVFAEITAINVATPSGTPTTLTAGVAAGAFVLPVAVGTGIAAGVWLGLGAGDTQEFHRTFSLVSLNVNLATQVLRAHASGEAVTVQTLTPLVGIVGGVTVAVSGSITTLRAETVRNSLGYRVANAAISISTTLNTVQPVSFYLAMGIPSTAYANSVLPIGKQMATALGQTLIFTGLTRSLKVLTIAGWNGAAVIGGESAFTQAAETRIPLSFKPNGIQVMVNA